MMDHCQTVLNQEIKIANLSLEDITQAKALFKISISEVFEREGLQDLTQTCLEEILYKQSLVEDSVSDKILDFTFLVAKQNDKVLGLISYGPCGKDIKRCSMNCLAHLGELGSLYVLPLFQNQGIGSALIQAMVEVLAAKGIDEFCLDSGYRSAQLRWRRKFGKPAYEVKDYWGKGMDHCVWLCKTKDILKSNSQENAVVAYNEST